MKKNILLSTLALLAVVLLAACSNDEEDGIVVDMLPKTRSIDLTEAQKEYIKKNNDFSFNLFKTINQQPKEAQSVICSPISVTYILGMLHDGATGTTEKEISSLLGFGSQNASEINELCKALIEGAPETDENVTLKIANYLAVNWGETLLGKFQDDMDYYYHAGMASLDFTSPVAVKAINDWCSKQTEGVIPEIVDRLPLDTKLVLMNAIYFKANWTNKFDPKDTKVEPFTLESGSNKELPMMHRKGAVLCSSNNTFTTIRLPYGSGDRWSMYVMLPNEGKTVDDVISNLSAGQWSKTDFNAETVDIKIPRFSLSSDIDLKPVISEMGAPTLFSIDAQLTNICEKKQLFVTLMKQKASIEVNEEGSKMAATTIAAETESGAPFLNGGDFHCTHPFVYLIQESSSGAIFFIGTFRGE